jgi:alkanesulfonate monooxygenase SsuD/methylene tetrahydromethanopterin reductase-like flavin-dependent oxidoreductase (luciferase family)
MSIGGCMKFGLFFEIQVPKPWDAESERRAFHEAIAQAELADELGYEVVWAAEHHFLEEYSHNPAPELFLAAVAARTKNIRICHGIKHLTTNHPLRVAEQAATLDIIADGRLELGLGEGSSSTELRPFGVRFRDKRDHWIDAVQAFIPSFWNETWSYSSERFSFEPRNVIPKPLQKPNPPLWVACSQTETIRQTARWGMGALAFAFADPDATAAWVDAYYYEFVHNPERLEAYAPNPTLGGCYYFSCAATDAEALDKADGATFFEFALGKYARENTLPAGESRFWEDYLIWRETDKAVAKQAALSKTMMIGSPDTLRARLDEIERTNIDHVVLVSQTGKTPHEDIMASIEMFGREVMPEFQRREPEHQAWKQAVLTGEIELQDVDTSDKATLLVIDAKVKVGAGIEGSSPEPT